MGNRARGEGNITKRKDGSFAGSIQQDGKRHFVYARTKGECAEKLRDLKRRIDDGVALDGGSLKLGEFLDRWLESATPNLKYKTREGYSQVIRDHIRPVLGNTPLKALRPDAVAGLLTGLTKKGLSPRSVQNVRAVLRRGLNVAVRWRYISSNPAAAVDAPSVRRKPPTMLTPEQLALLLATVEGHWLEPLYWTAVLLGLRKGELLALQMDDLDLVNLNLKVSGTLQWQGGRLVRETPKTEQSQRVVPLPDELARLLEEHKGRQQVRFPNCTYLFASSVGTPLNPRNLNRHLTQTLKRAGLPPVSFHSLRHACATEMLRGKVDVRTVAAILGHSQTSTTLNIYAHAVEGALREAVNGRGSAVSSAVRRQKAPRREGAAGH